MNLRNVMSLFAGGPGSGCNPDAAESAGNKCGRPPGPGEATDSDRHAYDKLKKEWAKVNNSLLNNVDRPDSPDARKKMSKLKRIVKQMHRLKADPGRFEDIGLPGGPRDMVIVGAGPGGLAAAVMGASDGLDTLFVDAQAKVGGQAKYSSRIENYPGFPVGTTGRNLAENMYEQATRLGAEGRLGVRVVGLTYDPETGLKTVKMSNGEEITARTVVIAGGVEFRKIEFPGSDSPDVIYGDGEKLAKIGKGQPVVIIGGSNGAAQAALGAARTASDVYVLARSSIEKSMSDYQVQALRNHSKIHVIENDELQKLWTNEQGRARKVTTKSGKEIPARALGVFVGGASNTDWLPQDVKRQNGKIVVDGDLATSMPGVFAVGDNRVGAIGRIGSAVGDGQLAQRNVYQYLVREIEKRKKKTTVKSSFDALSLWLETTKEKKQKRPAMSDEEFDNMIDQLFELDEQYPYLSQMVE